MLNKRGQRMRRLITAILVATVCLSGCKDSNVKNMSIAEISTEETIEIKKETTEEIKIETEKVIEEPETEESSASDSTEVTVAETMLEKKNEEQQWKQAYIKYITEDWEDLASENSGSIFNIFDDISYSLIYVDNDDIPELYISYPISAYGGKLGLYNGEQLEIVPIYNGGFSYIERQGLFFNSAGNMDVYYNIVYAIENGKVIEIGRGDFGLVGDGDRIIDQNGHYVYRYFWNGEEVASEEEYKQKISMIYSKTEDNVEGISCNADEIIEAINSF